jgi:predicted SAM-dependent methyltransferase
MAGRLLGRLGNRVRNSYKVRAVTSAAREFVLPKIRRMSLAHKLTRRALVWIHFGCGEIADDRFVNVDARPFSHVDYITKSPMMPAIAAGTVELIYACHVFEHISYFHGQIQTLVRWREMLRPGGRLILSVPDFDKVVALRAERGFGWMQSVLMGGQEYPGNFHYALFTRDHLTEILKEAGFTNIHDWRAESQDSWPKDWSWDESLSLNLMAMKP